MNSTFSKRKLQFALVAALVLVVTAIALLARKPSASKRSTATDKSNAMEGMDMSSASEAVVSDEMVRKFGITFGSVEERILTEEVRAAGVVAVDETRTAQVSARYSGFAERLYANFTGKPVRRGQILLDAYSPDILAAQEELLIAARMAKTAPEVIPGSPLTGQNLVLGARQRLRLLGVSDLEIEGVLRSGKARRTVSIYAPISGVITSKQVLPGQAFAAGQPLYEIADLSTVWIEAEIREADAGAISVGADATVELNALPGRQFIGRVTFIAPILRSETRTATARIELQNHDGQARPGMYATVRLGSSVRRAITVPTAAVVNTGERHVVFVDLGNGRLAPREIIPGRVAGTLTEVMSGLEPGQRVVTSAQYLLDSESNLADVMRSMMSQTGSSEMNMPSPPAPELQDKGASMKGMKMPKDSR